jgi:protease I
MARKNVRGLRVAVVAADGFEQVEMTSPMKALQRNGAITEIISLRPGRIRGVNLIWPGKKVQVNRTIFTADAEDYDALLIPGGLMNPDLLRQSKQVLNFVREFDASRKPIAVICHGPWVLASAGLVKGRTLTSWPGIKDDIRNAGGNWENEAVVRDDNWVSSRGPHDLIQFNRAMISLFAECRVEPPAREAAAAERGGVLPTLGWLAAGAALAVVAFGSSRAAQRTEVEEEELAAVED